MPETPTLEQLRAQLDAAFDDAQLDAFCLSAFPEVFDRFGRGQQRTEKVTLLLDHCRRRKELGRLAALLAAPRQAAPAPPLNAGHLAAYLDGMRDQCARLETRPYKALSELRGAPACLMLLETYEPLHFDLYPARAQVREGQELGDVKAGAARGVARTSPAAQHESAEAETSHGEASLRETSRLDVSFQEVLAEAGHVALLGKAGSGKTTVLRLATAALAAADPDLAAAQLGISGAPLPVPVFIALREFAFACQTWAPPCSRDVAGLLRFVDAQIEKRYPERVPAGFVSGLIRAGRAWIFLDALDEVANFDERIAVRQAIEALARAFPGNRLVVTARVAAYEHANTRLNADFNLAYVRDLTREQWAPLVGRLYAGLEANSALAKERTGKLLARIDGAPLLQEMVKTPLMVWTATLIHSADRELPEQRAELYQAYVEVLLGERLHEEEGAEAAQVLRDARWPAADRQLYLTYAAYKTHEGAAEERSRSGERGALVVVDETTLRREILAPFMAESMMLDVSTLAGRRKAEHEAGEFIKVMAERSGLLHAQPEGYTFGDHLTLQEFLAALYLVENRYGQERLAFLAERAGQSWWREVILLMAGSLLRQSRQAQDFLLKELGALPGGGDAHAYGVAWAGRALLEIPPARAGWHAGVRAELAQRLVGVLRQNPPQTGIAARVEVGEVLGFLGDVRFGGPWGLPEFIPLPGGEFWMGDDASGQNDEKPRHRVAIEGFALAKYPTTNAMFARFIEAKGYANPEWWRGCPGEFWRGDGTIKDWSRSVRSLPRYWDDERLNGANQPVVGVSWYEAVAYCRWLTATLHDGHAYRLPTEAEWEYAARGQEGRRYAWGDDWVKDRANTEELALGRTTPVGIFADGATPEGVLDLTGNVWEWCSDWYDGGEYARRAGNVARNPTGPKKGDYKVLRGGSWYNNQNQVRCAYRLGLDPGYVYDDRGFRVARGSLR